jgi:hypothetical protein
MAQRNTEMSPDRRILIRVGIKLGILTSGLG